MDAREKKPAMAQKDITPMALTGQKMAVLRWVDTWGDSGVYATPLTPGGTMAALSMAGLVEKVSPPPSDRIGGTRYRITERGRSALAKNND